MLVFTGGYVPPDLAEKIFDSGLLAGEAVYLCHRFGLPVPEWTEKPEYFLREAWNKSWDDSGEPEFKSRNVLFNSRHLIRL